MNESTPITVEKRDRPLLIGVNRTAKMNSFTWEMSRLMGAAHHQAEFDAAVAHRIALVQEVADDPLVRAIGIATTIAEQAPLAVRATLSNAWRAVEEGPGSAAKELESVLGALMQSADAMEGLASFSERRKAQFTGR